MSPDGWGRVALIVAMSIGAGLFAWLAVARRSGASLAFDLRIREHVHRWALPALTASARVAATLGSPIFLSVVFAIMVLAFHLLGWRRPAITLAEVMAGAVVGNVGLKDLIGSARPEPFFGTAPSSYSFPSGHAFYSLCFYGVLASLLAAHASEPAARLGIWVAATLLIAAIGLSRVYLGVHYPTDVIGGYLCAAFVLAAVRLLSPGWS